MAHMREKWVKRFIIPETTRHKRGFTVYKVISVVFLKSSHEEVSKVFVWKRYNDFKKLHSELKALYSRSQIKENFPTLPKSKFFGRFEAEVIEERRECALKFLEFIGKHSYLYSSDIFIKFFDTSHMDHSLSDCSQSLSSDTSEDDRHTYSNSILTSDIVAQNFQEEPKSIKNISIDQCITFPATDLQEEGQIHHCTMQSEDSKHSKSLLTKHNDLNISKADTLGTKSTYNGISVAGDRLKETISTDKKSMYSMNNNCDKNVRNIINEEESIDTQTTNSNLNILDLKISVKHDGSDLPQTCPDSIQYILIAAAHMSAAFRHEAMTEYEEAFTQYKMGISSLMNGIQSDTDKTRAEIIKEKISKYSERAEKLYNRYLNCNISLLNKPVSELQYYKVLKILKSVMVVQDVRQNCLRIVKAIEKSYNNKESLKSYILRGQVPYMVNLYACIETETTVFLILQHISRGKIWDFIMSHYKTNNETKNDILAKSNFKSPSDIDNIKLKESITKEEMDHTEIIMENLDFKSTNAKVQTNSCPLMIEEDHQIHNDMPTTQLLEKAQILLQSVNATLKESNSIANRLHESKHLTNQDNTTILNIKNSTVQPEKWNIILSDIKEISNKTHDMNKNEFQKTDNISLIENMPDQNLIIATSFSENDIRNSDSQYVNDSSSHSCEEIRHYQRNSTNSSLNNRKRFCNEFSLEYNDEVETDNVTNIYDLNGVLKNCYKCKSNKYEISANQLQYIDSVLLSDSVKNNNIDFEEEIWEIPENVICLWAAEILVALEALHQQEVIVFDLKPDNILLDDNNNVQLTYITPCHNIDLSKHKQPYASPELCMFLPTVPLTSATDIWSFGVILYELIVGNRFQTRHPGIFHSHSAINIPSKVSENAKSLLLNLLKYQPSERMTIPEIKLHPFFKDINWLNLVNSD